MTITTIQFQNISCNPIRSLVPTYSQSLFSVPSMLQPQATINLLSVSRDLSFLATSFKWNHIVGGLPHLASFTEHNVLDVHPSRSIISASFLFMAECYSIVRACVLSLLSYAQLFATLWAVARQAPLSVGFSRQEYWSG